MASIPMNQVFLNLQSNQSHHWSLLTKVPLIPISLSPKKLIKVVLGRLAPTKSQLNVMGNSPSLYQRTSRCHKRTRDIKLVLCFFPKLKFTHPLLLSVHIYDMPTKTKHEYLYYKTVSERISSLWVIQILWCTSKGQISTSWLGQGKKCHWSWAGVGQSFNKQSLGEELGQRRKVPVQRCREGKKQYLRSTWSVPSIC